MGGLGTGSGVILLILSLVLTGGLSLPAMIAMGATSTLLTLLLGAPYYYQAVNSIKTRTLTMDTLFTISTMTVIVVSLAAFVVPGLPMIFEAGLLIFGFRYLGLAIEETITERVVVEKKFRDRLPKEVRVLGEEKSLNTRKLVTIQAGELLSLDAGDIIPVDGECLTPAVVYDTIITGSVLPRAIKPGERVLAGMRLAENSPPMTLKASPITLLLEEGDIIPVDGVCEGKDCFIFDEDLQKPRQIKVGEALSAGTRLTSTAKLMVTAVANYSYLHRLDRNNEHAQFEKAPIEEATTQILQYFIPAVILAAILSGVVISLFFPPALALHSAISVLVAACPCTLGLITPLAVKIGINKAAEHGVQFKSAKTLQAAESVNAVVFDVHGTLTTGVPTVTDYAHSNLVSKKALLSYFAALERKSQHPIAKAIADFVNDKETDELVVDSLDESNHSGLKAKITRCESNLDDLQKEYTEEIILGNQAMMQENGIDVSAIQSKLGLKGGQSVVYLARNKQLLGYMVVTDPLRKDALETVTALKKMGKTIFICTGADENTAKRYAELLDIPFSNICWGCVGISENSQDNSKTAYIAKLQAQGFNVAMVGDAANDAVALARTFGIAIKSKSGDEVTQQQASAVVQGDSLLPVANIFAIANQTVGNIKQNLGFSLAYNLTSMLLTGGLLVAIGLTLNPAVGVALMILQTSLVLLNAYRFKSQRLEHLQPLRAQTQSEFEESYSCFNNLFNNKKMPTTPGRSFERENEFPARLFKPQIPADNSIQPQDLEGRLISGLQ